MSNTSGNQGNNSGNNNNDLEFFRMLLQNNQEHIQEQLKKLTTNSEKVSEHLQNVRIEMATLNSLVNTDIASLRIDVMNLEKWQNKHDQIITLNDLSGLKDEVKGFKKFQIQIITITFVVFSAFQYLFPPSTVRNLITGQAYTQSSKSNK